MFSGKKQDRAEYAVLVLLAAGLLASVLIAIRNSRTARGTDRVSEIRIKNAEPLDVEALDEIASLAQHPVQSDPEQQHLMVGDLRVIAIGSAYPIPYEAEVCPFTNHPQPAMNQLDRDGDGITDDWELKYGLNKYDAADAVLDPDTDGFTNLEEYVAGSDPLDAALHPPYATKLRFIERKDIPFSLVFQGFTELEDGTLVFQLNTPATGKSHFLSLGESVDGVVVKTFADKTDSEPARLFVMRDSAEIELIRGETALDPESKAELINILDRSPIIVTMGALLSLHNDEYMVLGVYPDRVNLRDIRTGKVYEIVGFTEGER